MKAYKHLLDSLEQYFVPSCKAPQVVAAPIVTTTTLPPIFLQRPGHSMTIVGLLFRQNGFRELLVFDPAYAPSQRMISLASALDEVELAGQVPKAYRRGKGYLKRFSAYETLRLTGFGPP